MTSELEFTEFAVAASPRLRRAAFLLCGDWHTAEDLVQTTMTKVFVSWRKIRRQDAAHAYAARTLVNTYLTDKRLKRSGEVSTDKLPERPAELPAPETRIVVIDALAMLPPKSRAVVVLRYWADMSVEQAAAVLGCSPGNVKSQRARALDKLRVILGDAMTESGRPARRRNVTRQTTSVMDETSLRDLLDSALTRESPMGPVARNSLQAGMKIRRRRRALGAAGSAAAVAVLAIAVPAATGALGHTSAVPRAGIPSGPFSWPEDVASGFSLFRGRSYRAAAPS